MTLRNPDDWTQMTSDEIHSLEAIVQIREHEDFPEQQTQQSIDEFVNNLHHSEPLRYKILYNQLRYAGDSSANMKNKVNTTLGHLPKNKYLKFAIVLLLYPALKTVSFGMELSEKYLQKIPGILGDSVCVVGFLTTGYFLSEYAYNHLDSTIAKAISLYYKISICSSIVALNYAVIKGMKLLSDSDYANLRERAAVLETPANYHLRNMFARKFEVDATVKLETDSNNKELMDDIVYFQALQKSD